MCKNYILYVLYIICIVCIKGLTSADEYRDIPADDVTYTEDDIIRWMTSAPMFSSSFTYVFQHVFPVCEQVSEMYKHY